jgi:hypothetical protein
MTTTTAVEFDEDADPTTIELPLGQCRLPLVWLIPAERNARRGSVGRVVDSLREFGQHRPMVVQRTTRQVIVGNHLYHGLRTLGDTWGDCLVVDDDDKKALRRAIADNAVGDHAQWDKQELAEQLKEVGPVPGFDEGEMASLLKSLEDKAKPDQEPVFPITPRFNEAYDYVVIMAENDMDAAWLRTRLGMRKEGNYKNSGVGTSHVLTVERAKEVIDGDVSNESVE